VPWVAVDALDPPLVNGANHSDASHSELYNVDAVAYESVLVGLFTIMRGKQTPAYGRSDDKWHGEYDGVYLAFSRNGFDWFRPPPAQGDAYRKLFAGQVIQDPPVGDINALEFLRRAVDRRWISHAQLDPTFFLQRPVAHASEPTISARCFRVLLHQLLDRHWHTAVGLQQCTAMPATVMALALVG
jgi:hypothetical protein